LFVFVLFCFFREEEREGWGRPGGKGKRESQAGSTPSAEPHGGLDPTSPTS